MLVSIRRTGGGFGKVSVSYSLLHETTDDSDVSAVASYTTSQVLTFLPGVVELTFRITVHDDSDLEFDESFLLHLHDSEGSSSAGYGM